MRPMAWNARHPMAVHEGLWAASVGCFPINSITDPTKRSSISANLSYKGMRYF